MLIVRGVESAVTVAMILAPPAQTQLPAISIATTVEQVEEGYCKVEPVGAILTRRELPDRKLGYDRRKKRDHKFEYSTGQNLDLNTSG